MSFNLAYRVPKWLFPLKRGNYTILQMMEITKASKANLYMRLNNLGVERTYLKKNDVWQYIYHWRGAKHYLSLAHRKDIEDLKG